MNNELLPGIPEALEEAYKHKSAKEGILYEL